LPGISNRQVAIPTLTTVPIRALALCLGALTACSDLPSAPQSFVREAGGATWVAVVEPGALPTARTWLATLPGDGPEGAEARATLADAARVRKEGHAEAALALEERAALEAAGALPRAPEPRLILVALAGLDEWAGRAALRTSDGDFPELRRSEREVRDGTARARSLMAAGDTLGAVRAIAVATGTARRWSPVSVALRVVRDAERRIDSTRNPSANLVRARHLLRGAREGLAIGDEMKALQRAMYALQLIEQEGGRGRRR
jgi:hypothetical protein